MTKKCAVQKTLQNIQDKRFLVREKITATNLLSFYKSIFDNLHNNELYHVIPISG